ncbi:DNA topoisomerase IB [uncultured Winogradskyella sp.]|uniref:DNA topoisomerase IB n=1 Tax=uncultured Winogradskyella sp. TaxID=395353 RepID=UPI0026214C16|nr:DNA topoisomerase IB [uncultured Winogradskyella sp.]
MKFKKYSNPKFIAKLIKEPESVIDTFELIYTSKDKLKIRRKKNNKKFVYKLGNKELTDQKQLTRIESLVIPPAWKKVKIAIPVNAHIQAVGRDLKNRKQYRYHALWTKIRNQTKFFKMAAFGEQLPKIRQQVEIDIEQNGWPKTKVIALVIRLMEETHIRIGNEQYAKRNKTYGLATMRTKHISIFDDKLAFNFVGKKGKEHSIILKDKKLIRLVNKCEDIPGWELFQYFDKNNEKRSIDSSMINNYIHNITGDIFTAKDYRTWAATNIFFESLLDLGIAKKKKRKKKNILKAFDKSAKALGNTRNVCRKYYVHPAVVNKYISGNIKADFAILEANPKAKDYLSETETVVLDLIKNYVPTFLIE